MSVRRRFRGGCVALFGAWVILAGCGASASGDAETDAGAGVGGGGAGGGAGGLATGGTTGADVGASGASGLLMGGLPADAGPGADASGGTAPDAGEPPRCGGEVGPDPGDPLTIHTTEGPATGRRADGALSWLGLPFAAPPVDALRFAPPAPPACRDALFVAQTFAPKCVQVSRECATGTGGADCAVEGQEDCLYLNVWRPEGAAGDARPRPVLFFIHGGGNAIGSTSEETAPGAVTYDGAALATLTDALVVTAAYRLGPFGFAAHRDLSLPENGGQSGNYGILDQIAALQWVHDNAAALEADAGRVMIFGESAGAVNVCMLLASPLAAGLFGAALMESGGCPAYLPAPVEGTTSQAIAAVGCADAPEGEVACLRAKPAADILRALPPEVVVAGRGATFYQPHVDGHVLPEAPLEAFAGGRANAVPTLIGSNADETAASLPPIPNDAAYEAAVTALVGPLAPAVLEQYPVSRFESPWEAMMRVTTDAKFVCPTRGALRALAAAPNPPTLFRYFYTHRLDNLPRRQPYAQHGIELLFVFQHLMVAGYRPSADETALAAFMGSAWGALAATGDPTPPGGPTWPPFTADGDEHMVLEGGTIAPGAGVRTEDCDFWDSLL